MDYKELYEMDDFQRNMRRTPWTKLFPHWWSENDDLLKAIGDEVERVKAQAIFTLLNAGLKPPVLLWQESLVNDHYTVNETITRLPSTIKMRAPFYKTWGTITLTNNTEDDIDGLKISLDDEHGLMINDIISKSDVITIDLHNNKVKINDKNITAQKIGQGIPYFITTQNDDVYDESGPLHNEIVQLKINTDINAESTSIINTINLTEDLDNWTLSGDAYEYNEDGADPWLALNGTSRISYKLDFTNIYQIAFWYKTENNAELVCYCHDKTFKQQPNATWTYYTIDTHDITGIHTIDFENTSSVGTSYINDIKYTKEDKYNIKCDIDVNVTMDNVVFVNEQNIEVTGLELIPIERIELYAKYDFPYNQRYNGWRKVYQKKYDDNTNVVYDMITTHFFTKEFYVDVWFKTLQYPYRVGFPATQHAEEDSMYHVNNRLDSWGEQLGLERRLYKEDILEQNYYDTFPAYYPFDIEQDYWYYSRLANEYTWNEYAINDVDILDTNGDNIVRLYSINPFCEDFVIHAKSIYPTDTSLIKTHTYNPKLITQQNSINNNQQVAYNNIINLLLNNDKSTSITLNNNTNNNDVIYKKRTDRYRNIKQYTDNDALSAQERNFLIKANQADMQNSTNLSKELITYFDLSDLPEDINIDNIEVIVEGDSTDNKTDKFTTQETGLLIPDLYSDSSNFIPLTSNNTYQLKKRNIIYSNNNFDTYQNDIVNNSDNFNVLQTAVIGKFQNKISDIIQIPFQLKEGDEDVDDINKVYLYFDNILKEGYISTDKHGNQCIECEIPTISSYTQITIIVKSVTHSPFTTTIDIKKEAVYKYVDKNTNKDIIIKSVQDNNTGEIQQSYYFINDNEEEELITDDVDVESVFDYYNIVGPIVENIVTDTQVTEEWRTNDLRNILQRQGVYFRHILQNDNPQSSTSVFLYNVSLKVYYSPKQATFQMKTYVDTKDAILPNIGKYHYYIKNTGTKPLATTIDIFNPPNITLATNNIPIYLNPGDTDENDIDIKANYPLIDGFYDIVTTCEDKVYKNSVQVFSDGLIRTGVQLKPHHGKYYDNITLSADVYAIDNSKIHGGVNHVQFYINGYAVGQPVIVQNNHAEITITPGNYNFTGTGVLRLEARFLGTNKYAASRGQSTIFISKNSTRIIVEAPTKAIYQGSYEAKAKVEYYDGQQYLPVDDGAVEFYINGEILGLSNTNDIETFKNGYFTIQTDSLENPIGDYTLFVRYVGSEQYASVEEAYPFEIIGGKAFIYGYDENIKPHDSIQLKAKIVDANRKNIPYGYVDFCIPELNQCITNVPVKDGIAISPSTIIDVDIEDDETKILDVIIQYHNAENNTDNIYSDSNNEDNPAHIIVKKSEVYFEYPSLYKGSQYEPLGFLIKVADMETGEYINHGTVTITLPEQNNVSVTADIDADGIARLIYNPITFSAKEWSELNKFKFTTANYDANLIDIINDTNIPETDIVYDANNLYKIYDGSKIDIYDDNNQNIGLVNFENQVGVAGEEDGLYILYTNDENRQVKEHVFISEDGCLYSRTTFDDLRIYNTGLQDIIVQFNDTNNQYVSKKVTLEKVLNINAESVDIDIHSYDLTYTDNDNIICYVSQYTHGINDENYTENPQNFIVNQGTVEFLIDNISLQNIEIADNGQAQLANEALSAITPGNHLMHIRYFPEGSQFPTTNSYSFLTLHPLIPILDLEIDRITKGRKSNIKVSIKNVYSDIPFNGIINLYMNNEIIDTQYLYGNEMMPGIVTPDDDNINIDDSEAYVNFVVTLPDDIDINEYVFDAEFLGNDYYESTKTENYLHVQQVPAPVTLNIQDVATITNGMPTITVGKDEQCILDVNINVYSANPAQNLYDDIINEGQVVVYYDNDIVTKQSVIDNNVQLKWTPVDNGQYTLKYENGINYQHAEDGDLDINYKNIQINTINPLDEITIPNEYCSNIQQALMCLKPNGTIILDNQDESSTNVILSHNLNIYKDCNIIGTNDTHIIKDAPDLVTSLDDIRMYNIENLDLSNLYEIIDLKITNLNTNDFVLEDNELYYYKNGKKLLIYFADNNKFYTSTYLSLDGINSETNINIAPEAHVHIKNIIFESNDNSKNVDFIINNEGYLVINHCVLSQSIELRNTNTLMAQRNLMYCKCTGGGDLNNNWWGSNTAPYDVDNNIVLKVDSDNTPAVISEQVNIIGKLIGANGREYDLPASAFTFTADSGYFSIDTGVLVNNQIQTTYLDAEKEGNIYFTVDNETIAYPIYDYERKTEVIIDDITDIPINHQVTINAKVQSCADTYYVFDKNNNITKNSKSINTGFMTFYINDKQVGYSKVKNGKASANIFFTDAYYTDDAPYQLKVIYNDDDYYFASTAEAELNIIMDDINNLIYYVSPENGSDNNNGLYNAPFKTIEHAIDCNADVIYLLDGHYTENNINIDNNVTIKAFGDNISFDNLTSTMPDDTIFDVAEDVILNIEKIDFMNNSFNYLFNNDGIVQARKCIFYNNNDQVFKTTNINASYCVFVDNDIICPPLDNKGDCFLYCWFGDNNPQESIDDNIDNNIIMTISKSKDKIYIGTLVQITGELLHYKNGNIVYNLDDDARLPLRIAKFATDYGSMKPITDYTYYNKSTSLLNTNEDNNTTQYILTLPENKNYVGRQAQISCYVQDVLGNNVTSTNNDINNVKISVYKGNININKIAQVNDGIGTITIDKLPLGEYNIECSYEKDNQVYMTYGVCKVQKPEIIVQEIRMTNNTHLYHTFLEVDLRDNFNNLIENTSFDISIDGTPVTSYFSTNSKIETNLSYTLLKAGQHTLTISCNNRNSNYEDFNYEYLFISKAQNTHISFEYNKIEAQINNNLLIEVFDEENNYVQDGIINIELDNQPIISDGHIYNGQFILAELHIPDVGQHSIMIHYSGVDGYYNDSINVKNIGVGIFNVASDLPEDLYADIGYDFELNVHITDVSNQIVNQGYANLYIDDIQINDTPIYINNGLLTYHDNLPINISTGKHNFTLEYIDNMDIYLDTYFYSSLHIGKIPTEIVMDYIYGAPGELTTINYTISTSYGDAKTGTLTALYNDNIIGQGFVTDSITNQINIIVPFVPATDDYDITFKYTDDSDMYDDSQADIRLIIQKNNVNIQPSHTWYYPDKTFHFDAMFTDKSNNVINTGTAALYIDNVKESESLNVINGHITLPLTLPKARTYPMTIVYEDNDYYKQTTYSFDFKVNSIDINDIIINNITNSSETLYLENNIVHSLPNTNVQMELIYDTLDQYNVKDGIIDILIDDVMINNYYVAESNKYISFDIGNLNKGEHTLTFKYHDSSLFNDIDKTYTLNIIAKNIILNITNVVGEEENRTIVTQAHNDSLTINTYLSQQVNGFVKYYIGLPIYRADNNGDSYIWTYDYKFIGLQDINNEQNLTHQYTLQSELLEYAENNDETKYKIKVIFEGNTQYNSAEDEVNLHIQKNECNINFDETEYYINYREKLIINFTLDALGTQLVEFKMNDKNIGSVITSEGQGVFEYIMHSDFIADTEPYTLTASFNGSAINTPANASVPVYVIAATPIIDTKDITANKCGILPLDNILTGTDGIVIDSGYLKYKIYDMNDRENALLETDEYKPNQKARIQLPSTITQDKVILEVSYISDNNLKYSGFTKDINLILNKNEVKFDINIPDAIYRGEQFMIDIYASSTTTQEPINIDIECEHVEDNNEQP